jgi:hypothetical protein
VRTRSGAIAGVAAVVLSCALAGGVAGAADEPLTKQQFIEAGDAICQKADTVLDAIAFTIAASGGDGPPSAEQIEQFVEQLVPVYQGVHDDIDDLAEPRVDRARIKKLLASFQRELDAIERDPSRVQDPAGPFPKASKLAIKYGFEVCAH